MDELRSVLAGCGESGTVTISKPLLVVLEALNKRTKTKPNKGDISPLGGSGAIVDVAFLRKCLKAAPGGITTDELFQDEPEEQTVAAG